MLLIWPFLLIYARSQGGLFMLPKYLLKWYFNNHQTYVACEASTHVYLSDNYMHKMTSYHAHVAPRSQNMISSSLRRHSKQFQNVSHLGSFGFNNFFQKCQESSKTDLENIKRIKKYQELQRLWLKYAIKRKVVFTPKFGECWLLPATPFLTGLENFEW